jgi:molybdopterin-guanine dinucleotide biosynthesis protein A
MAGGRSTRMGEPKALLKFGSVTLIERTVAELRRAFSEVIVVAAPPNQAGFALPKLEARTVFDPTPFEGPLLALKLGLETMEGKIAFVCPCDAPALRAEVGLGLCAALDDYDAAIPFIDGRFQPLLAAYHKRCWAAAQALLERGERRLRALVPMLKVRILDERAMRVLDPELSALFNVNTPDDYHAVLRRPR